MAESAKPRYAPLIGPGDDCGFYCRDTQRECGQKIGQYES